MYVTLLVVGGLNGCFVDLMGVLFCIGWLVLFCWTLIIVALLDIIIDI